jgi:hypothetical protein
VSNVYYFNILWGSVGWQSGNVSVSDTLTFYDANMNEIGAITGYELATALNFPVNTSVYIQVRSPTAIGSVVVSEPSGGNGYFEHSDVTFSSALPSCPG